VVRIGVGAVSSFGAMTANEPVVCSLRGEDFGQGSDVELLLRTVNVADPELVIKADVDVPRAADNDSLDHAPTGHAASTGGA
jgi:hypothetical protein